MIVGTGIDIIEINRVKQARQRWGKRFVAKVLTQGECDLCPDNARTDEFVAGRFAAKEAIYKAINDQRWTWHDVSILTETNGRPHCVVHRPEFNDTIHLSISHSQNYAIANAIIEKK